MADNHSSESQKEYNELLNMTQSMLGSISDAMRNLDAQTDGRNKKLSQQISLTQGIVESIKNEKDLRAAINLLNQDGLRLSQQNFGVNQRLLNTFLAQRAALQGILEKHKSAFNVLNKVGNITDSVKDKFGGIFDSISHGLGEIPFIGKTLENMFHPFAEKSKRMFGIVAEKFKMGFGKAFTNSLAAGNSFSSSLVSGIAGGFKKAAGAARLLFSLMNPLVLAAVGIAAAIGLGFHRFHAVEQAASEFKNTTGLASADLHDIEHTVGNVSNKFGKLGANANDVAGYMAEFNEAFDGLVIPAESTVAAIAVLNKNFGVTAKSAGDVNKIFQNMGGLSESQAQYLANSVVEMSNLVGISPERVMKDMADNAGTAYEYFRGSPEELAKAAVYAAKMGSSIKDMTASADKLLNFEESISKELEASALLGTNLDFSKARELAYTGDLLGMQKELTKELANVGDINKLSSYEKQALVDATGQELSTLLNTQRIYNQFGDLDEERLAAANALIESGKDITKVGKDELEAQTARMAKQQKMQDMMTGMGNKMSAIGTAIGDAFAPVAGLLIQGLSGAVNILSAVLIPTFQALGMVIKIAVWPFQQLGHVFEGLIGYIKEYYDYIVAAGVGAGIVLAYTNKTAIAEAAVNAYKFIGTQLTKEGYIYKAYDFIQTQLAAGAQLVYNGYLFVANTIKKRGLLAGIAEMAISAYTSIAKIPFIGPILGAVAAVAAYALGKSYMSKAGDVYSPADGKTQISTKEGGLFELSPNDDVLAAPGLASAMNGSGGGVVQNIGAEGGAVSNLINTLIAEMQGIRNDLATGKVAVYLSLIHI